MRTVNKVGDANGTTYTEFYGNTTDVKPIVDVPNGSAFYEIDNNMQEYRFDKENKIWYPITKGGTPPSSDYLPLSGGIMTGDINMNGNSLLNAKSITLKDETGEYTVALNLVHLGTTNPETGEPFSYEAIEFSDSDDTNKQYVITGVADPLLETDAVNLRYLGENYIPLTGTKENKPVTGPIVMSSVSGQAPSVIVMNDNIDRNKVTSETLITNEGIFINGRNYAGFKMLGSLRNVNSLSFSSTDENDKHDTISMTYNTEYKYLNFNRFTEDKGLLPVLMRGADTPVEDNDISNKKYVDDSISTLTTTIGDNYIPLTGTADRKPVSGSIVLGENGWINGNKIAFVKNIIRIFSNSDESKWRIELSDGGIVYYWNNNFVTQLRCLQADSIGFVGRATDSIRLSNIGTPTNIYDAANKAYVDQETAKYLPLTGGNMKGDISLDSNNIYDIKNITYTGKLQQYFGNKLLWSLYIEDNNIVFTKSDNTNIPIISSRGTSDNNVVVNSQLKEYLSLSGTATDKPVTGDIVFDGTHTVTGVKEPENDTDVATKKYADVIKADLDNIKKKKNVVIYVGSAELSDEQKLSCDYICDGVDDQIEIIQAIDSLPDSGGEVHLSRGIFNITNPIYIRKRIKLVGEGKGVTLDRNNVNSGGTTLLSENTSGSVIQIEKSDTLLDIKGITLSDFQIVGAGINVENNFCNGINVDTYTDCVTLERLSICHCFYGLFVGENGTIDDISVTNCDFQRDSCGIYINGKGWQTRIENNIFWDMSGRQPTSGIVLSSGKNIVIGNYFGVSSLVAQDRTVAWIFAKNAVSLLCNGNSFSRCTSSPIRFEAGGQFASISGNSFSDIGKAQFAINERAVLYINGGGTGGGRISFTDNTVFWANGDDWKTSYLAYLTNQVAQVNISNNTVIDGIGKITEEELVYKSENSTYAITVSNNVLC